MSQHQQIVQVGEIWQEGAERGPNVWGWVSMKQDGSREVLYGSLSTTSNLYYNPNEYAPEDGYVLPAGLPLPVATRLRWTAGITNYLYAAGIQRRLWINDTWDQILTEPPNQASQFFEWREHLMQLSSAYVNDHHYERSSVEHGALYRIPIRPSVISDEEMVRNGNITQYQPCMIGHLWRLIHEWAKLPVDQKDGPEYEYLNRIIPQFCKIFEDGRDCLGDIHMEHNHRLWERHLLAGKRFLPDKSSEPYGIIDIPEAPLVSSFVRGYDKRNFSKSIRLFRKSSPGGASHPWPESVNAEWYEPMPQLPPIPEQADLPESSAYEREQEITFWSRQYLEASYHEKAANPFLLLAYRRFVEMQLLMVMRVVNWTTRDGLHAIGAARLYTSDYYFDNDDILNAIFRTWIDPVTDAAANAWDFGYLEFDVGLSRAIGPNQLDPRIGGPVVLIPEVEIDRTDVTAAAFDQPWTDQAVWVALLNRILG